MTEIPHDSGPSRMASRYTRVPQLVGRRSRRIWALSHSRAPSRQEVDRVGG
jgi:hypothetical protein